MNTYLHSIEPKGYDTWKDDYHYGLMNLLSTNVWYVPRPISLEKKVEGLQKLPCTCHLHLGKKCSRCTEILKLIKEKH